MVGIDQENIEVLINTLCSCNNLYHIVINYLKYITNLILYFLIYSKIAAINYNITNLFYDAFIVKLFAFFNTYIIFLNNIEATIFCFYPVFSALSYYFGNFIIENYLVVINCFLGLFNFFINKILLSLVQLQSIFF